MCLARLSSLDSLERFFGRSGEFGTFLPMTSVDMPFGSSRRSRSATTTTTPLQPARITLRRLRIGECCRSPLVYLYRIPALYPEKTSIPEGLVESKWTFRICFVVSFVLGGCWGVCGELSAPSPGDDLRSKSAIRLRGQTVRSDSFWEIGCDFSAVTMRLRLRCMLR